MSAPEGTEEDRAEFHFFFRFGGLVGIRQADIICTIPSTIPI